MGVDSLDVRSATEGSSNDAEASPSPAKRNACASENRSACSPVGDSEAKEVRLLRELGGSCAYFPLGDYHNIKLFERQRFQGNKIGPDKLKKEISNRLLMSLLLFDSVIVHCSDPLRSQIVLEIMEENVDFIESGALSVLFSNSIECIRDDFRQYIADKASMYKTSNFCQVDIESLDQEHMSDEYYLRVISMLEKVPYMVKKGVVGAKRFKELIEDDLSGAVEPVILPKLSYNDSIIKYRHLTLYQLMRMRYVIKKSKIRPVFEEEGIEDFIEKLRETLSGDQPFSRHIIVEELAATSFDSEASIRIKRLRGQAITAIEIRLSRLYSMLNSGPHFVVEFSPIFEQRSAYSWNHFSEYLAAVGGKGACLSPEVVAAVRNNGEWALFKTSFLSSMVELHAQVDSSTRSSLSANGNPTSESYMSVLAKHDFHASMPEISKILLLGVRNV